MKAALRALAFIVAFVTVIIWAALGANRGWTKTEAEIKTMDEITGIEGISYEEKFQPGVDFLAVGLLGAGLLAGVSLFVRSKSN